MFSFTVNAMNGSPESVSKSTAEKLRSIGVLWGNRARGGLTPGFVGPPAYGAVHANRALIDAALAYLPQPVTVYAKPNSLDLARQHVRDLVHRLSLTNAQRRVAPVSLLPQGWSDRQLALWFNTAGDICSIFYFRAALGSSEIPIVSLHHTISYRGCLQTRFLLLLLAGPQPFDAVICTTCAAKQALEHAIDHTAESLERGFGVSVPFRGKLPVLPLGVDTDAFSPRDKKVARSALGIRNGDLVLLFLGRISPVDKGDLLPWLQTLCRLPESIQERLFVILAGRLDSDAAAEISRFIAEEHIAFRIDLRGVVPEHLKPVFYSAADVFISPADSVQEMFGLAPLEAMACGVPQIVADWDGYRDIVVDGETGFLIPTVWAPCTLELDTLSFQDPENWRDTHFGLGQSVAIDCDAFLQQLTRLLGDADLRAQMSVRSRERAIELFSWPVVARQYGELFDALIDEAKASAKESEHGGDGCFRQPSYFELFHHFASKNLTPDAVLRGSSTRFQDSVWAARLPYAASQDLDSSMIRFIVDAFDAELGEMTVQRAIDACQASNPHATPSLALRHLMWLLKYGFLMVGQEATLHDSNSLETLACCE